MERTGRRKLTFGEEKTPNGVMSSPRLTAIPPPLHVTKVMLSQRTPLWHMEEWKRSSTYA